MTETERRPVALVSGGSRGIGRAVVARLAADGYDVAFCYHGQSGAAASCIHEAQATGARVIGTQVDVSNAAEVQGWTQTVERELGPVSVLVNSAGIVRDKSIVQMTDEDWNTVLDTNLTGTFLLCRAVIFSMLKRRTGSIVNLSSVAGLDGNAGQTNYSAAKAGIIAMTKTLAKEVARSGVRANVIAPGFIETDMTGALDEHVRNTVMQRIPLGRWGSAEEVADLVSFLASDCASYITAGVFRIDGGLSL